MPFKQILEQRFTPHVAALACALVLAPSTGSTQKPEPRYSPFGRAPSLYEVANPASYETPQMCSIALDRMEDRLSPPDTGHFVPGRDSTPALVTAAARGCLTKFSVPAIKPEELRWLLRIALKAQDDATARELSTRMLAGIGAAPRDARAFLLRQIIADYMTAVRPARVHTAESYATTLDSIAGDESLEWRLAGHNELIMYYRKAGDEQGIVKHAQAWVTHGSNISARNFDRLIRATPGSYVEFGLADIAFVMELDAIRRGPDATLGLRDQLHTLLRSAGSRLPALPEIDHLIDFIFAGPGTRPPPVRGDFWTGASHDAVRPVPGKVNLVIIHPVPRMGTNRGTATSQLLAPHAELFRRMAARYGDSLAMTIVDHTNGYFVTGYTAMGSMSLSFGTPVGPLTPAAEADSIGRYYTSVLRIPAVVAVEHTTYTTLPAPDGRRVNALTPTVLAYKEENITEPVILLIDASGMVRYACSLSSMSENLLIAGIAGLLHAR